MKYNCMKFVWLLEVTIPKDSIRMGLLLILEFLDSFYPALAEISKQVVNIHAPVSCFKCHLQFIGSLLYIPTDQIKGIKSVLGKKSLSPMQIKYLFF